MPVCVPIKDMRDTAKFSELVETTTGPVTVTKNGYSKILLYFDPRTTTSWFRNRLRLV